MRVKMLEDRKVCVDGVSVVDCEAGETYTMGDGIASGLIDQHAAEPAAGETYDPDSKDDGAADENKDGGGEDENKVDAAELLAKTRKELEDEYHELTGGDGSKAPNKQALIDAIVAAHAAAAAGE